MCYGTAKSQRTANGGNLLNWVNPPTVTNDGAPVKPPSERTSLEFNNDLAKKGNEKHYCGSKEDSSIGMVFVGDDQFKAVALDALHTV